MGATGKTSVVSNNNQKVEKPDNPHHLSQEMYEFLGGYHKDQAWSEDMDSETFKNMVKSINPNYSTKKLEYRVNCALCSTAFALKMMGYDVEAMPKDPNKWRGFNGVFNYNWNDSNNFIAPELTSNGWNIKSPWNGTDIAAQVVTNKHIGKNTKQATNNIIKFMEDAGTGSIAVMNVKWKEHSGAHAVNVINGGKHGIMIVDSQVGKIYKGATAIQNYLKRTEVQKTGLYRVDNQKIYQSPSVTKKIVKPKKSI